MNKQEYEQWWESRNKHIELMLNKVDKNVASQLDFSPESLKVLGQLLVDNYASLDELHDQTNLDLLWGLSTYPFEVYRKNLNMESRLPLEDVQYQYYGMPVLHVNGGADLCPFDLVTFTVHRRKPELMFEVYCNQLKDIALTDPQQSETKKLGTAGDATDLVGLFKMSDEEFDIWLTFITDQLESFFASMDIEIAANFDFSPESLRFVGKALFVHKQNFQDAPSEELLKDILTYVGETFQRNSNSIYFLPQERGAQFFGLPCLKKSDGTVISLPHLLLDGFQSDNVDLLYQRLLDFKNI